MLNKELMLYSKDNLPYTHTIRVGRYSEANYLHIGFFMSSWTGELLTGAISPNTVLINDVSRYLLSICSVYVLPSYTYSRLSFHTKWYSPVVDLYLGRADTREVAYYDGGDFDTGFIEYTNPQGLAIKFTEEDVGKDIHLWIATTPPPWA